VPPMVLLLCILLCRASLGQVLEDHDMEAEGLGPWHVYGTPLSVEKSSHARTGMQSLHVVTDNKDTMGGNYEGTSRSLGAFEPGDLICLSFWYDVKGSGSIVAGIGRTSFEGRWVLSGTDWTRADLTLRCAQPGTYNVWLSQEGEATDFYLDDFELQVIRRPRLGTAPAEDRVALTGGPLRLTLDRKTGALCGIENLATGETYADVGPRRPLFSAELLAADGLGYEKLPFTEATLIELRQDNERAARLQYTLGKLVVTVYVALADDGAATFTGSVHNATDRPLLSFELPIVSDAMPAEDPERLTLVDPYVCGRIVPDATKSTGCHTTYPGRGVMGWMDLYGERGGLYLATHDESSTATRLMALPAPGPAFDLSLTREIVVRPGETWQCPRSVLAVHEGDWHAGADRYRAWAESWMQPPDVPQWMHEANGWVLMGVQNGIEFRRIPDVFRSAQWMGIDYLHVQGQGIDNMWFDAEGNRKSHPMTFLYPSPKFGTPQELKAAVDAIHARDGHVMFYYLYERWTPSLSVSEDFGSGRRSDVPPEYRPPGLDFYYESALVERPGGTPPTEHPEMAERIMCLDAPGWKEWMRRWAIDVYARQYGADGFYWDVMGRGGPFRCFNERHGHQGQNHWARGCADVLKTVLAEGRRINPDYAAAIEGCSDVLGQWNGFHLMSGATMHPNVFRYTFPRYLLVDGFSNTTWKLTHPQKAHRVFLDGERFDIHGYDQRVKRILNLRRRIKPFIDWPAVFRDTVGITVSDPQVQARAFCRTDGENRVIAITMMNEDAVDGATVEVDLSPIGEAKTAHLFALDGRVEALEVGSGPSARLAVPADAVSAAVIVAAIDPALAAVPWLEQITEPGQDGAVLSVFCPLGPPAGLRWSVDWPEAYAPHRQAPADDGPCLRRVAFLDDTGLAGLKHWDRAKARIAWEGGSADTRVMLAPPLVNGDFEEVTDGYLAYWGAPPCADDPFEGTACIRLDQTTAPLGHVSLLTPVKPDCEYRFRVSLKAMAAGGVGAHVVEYEEGGQFVRSAALNAQKVGEWETLETTFRTHLNPRSTAIYLYNFSRDNVAWFDGIELEEVR